MSAAAGPGPGASRLSSPPPSLTRPSSRAGPSSSSQPSTSAGVPTPVSNGDLSRRQGLPDPGSSGSASGKRKRNEPVLGMDSLLKASIVLKPYPSSLTVKPRILHPLMLLPREHLPLSALDLSQPHGDFPSSRLFESKIKILDLEGRMGSSVLLARSETTGLIYAIEPANSTNNGNGLYVLCKLGAWVDIGQLSQKALVACRERLKPKKQMKAEETDLPLTTPLLYKENKRRRLAIEEIQSIVSSKRAESQAARSRASSVVGARPPSVLGDARVPPEVSLPEKQETQAPGQSSSPAPPPAPAESVAPSSSPAKASAQDAAQEDDPFAQPSAEELFQIIRTQYMEALYHSKGSLAYFAKGPLSRARAAFQHSTDSRFSLQDLIDFLRSLIINTVLIDKKYRETIPEIVARIKTLVDDSEKGSRPKKRKRKKPKLGKDGLYPGEIEHIKKWWTALQPQQRGVDDDDDKIMSATETKFHISCLRRRETQLQIILILEILALEAQTQPPQQKDSSNEVQQQGGEPQAVDRENSQEPPAKKRNKHNLPVLLDVHADRLCIWQTTALDEVKALAETQAIADGEGAEKPKSAHSDPLRDFCVDIIIPFFSARLPSPCDALNRKLGGPIAQSPPKPKASAAAKPTGITKAKPGAPVKRVSSASKRDSSRRLERALSVERSRRSVSQGPATAIALMRSASNTVVPGLKREASEPRLLGIISSRPETAGGSLKERPVNMFPGRLGPSTGSSTTARSRANSNANNNAGAGNETSSGNSAEDLRAKRKAQVEAELRDAISTLKKPNRTAAVKEYVEAAEKRAQAAGQLKKLKKLARPSLSSTIVKATPANNRFKDALSVPPQPAVIAPTPPHNSTTAATSTQDAIPPSSASIVPQSTLPRKFTNKLSAAGDRVQATPLRSSLLSGRVDEEGDNIPPSSPAGGMFGSLFETPVAARSRAAARGSALGVMQDTPVKGGGSASRLLFPSASTSSGVAGKRGASGGLGLGDGNAVAKRAEEKSSGNNQPAVKNEKENDGEGKGLSIYQRLGWDPTDLDDIDILS